MFLESYTKRKRANTDRQEWTGRYRLSQQGHVNSMTKHTPKHSDWKAALLNDFNTVVLFIQNLQQQKLQPNFFVFYQNTAHSIFWAKIEFRVLYI